MTTLQSCLSRADTGLRSIDCGGFRLAVLIPSRNRSERIHMHPLLSVANLFVHESEVPAYRDAEGVAENDMPVFAHQRTSGMADITNDILDFGFGHSEVDVVVRIDDDVRGFQYNFTRVGNERVEDTLGMVSILASNAQVCLDAGIGLFGFNISANPRNRSAHRPFLLRHWIRGAGMGVCKRDLRCHPGLLGYEDVDLSLQSMDATGMVWTDQRYFLLTRTKGRNKDSGGLEGMRTPATYDEALERMTNYWPGVVVAHWDESKNGYTTMTVKVP